MRWNHDTKEAITATNIHGEPYEIAYPVGIIEGNDYDYLWNIIERIIDEEEVGTEDDVDWAAYMMKYGMLDCCEGRHVDSQLDSLGYEKKGGGHDEV